MNRDTAEKLIGEYIRYGDIMERLTELSKSLDVGERTKVRNAAAEASFALYEGLVRTVVSTFPDLEPEDHKLDE